MVGGAGEVRHIAPSVLVITIIGPGSHRAYESGSASICVFERIWEVKDSNGSNDGSGG